MKLPILASVAVVLLSAIPGVFSEVSFSLRMPRIILRLPFHFHH